MVIIKTTYVSYSRKRRNGRRYTSSKINAYVLVKSKGNDWTVI
jgi:hypothetical protein